MAKFFYITVIVVVIFVGLTFTYMNNQVVEIAYLSFSTEIHMSLLLLITLIFGVLLGFFANFVSSIKLRRNLSSARKEIKGLQTTDL